MDGWSDPIGLALQGRQRGLGVLTGGALKYRWDVGPFASVTRRDAEGFRDLASLMTPGEVVYLMAEAPAAEPEELVPGLRYERTGAGLQMVLPERAEVGSPPPVEVTRLACEDAPDMVALTEAAFPGYFRMRTCEMGTYYGVRVDGRLVSMAGERMKFDRYVEVSGVCTLPGFTGRGYAAALILRLLQEHRRDGWISFLHLSASNMRALELYRRLGFVVCREVGFHRVVRA